MVGSIPLAHWFYLASTSNGLGMQGTLEVIIDALPLISGAGDIPDVRDAVMMVLESNYDTCDDEVVYTAHAWDDICIGLPFYDACIKVGGDDYACEEDTYTEFFIENPVAGGIYRWYFPFDWTVPGSVPNSNMFEGNMMIVKGFGEDNYYPIYKEITVTLVNGNGNGSHLLQLYDCDGNDPGCDEFLQVFAVPDNYDRPLQSNKSASSSEINEIFYWKIFDINGSPIYEGSEPEHFLQQTQHRLRLYLLSGFDALGNHIKTEKRVIF